MEALLRSIFKLMEAFFVRTKPASRTKNILFQCAGDAITRPIRMLEPQKNRGSVIMEFVTGIPVGAPEVRVILSNEDAWNAGGNKHTVRLLNNGDTLSIDPGEFDGGVYMQASYPDATSTVCITVCERE